jgi:hypothetical protein
MIGRLISDMHQTPATKDDRYHVSNVQGMGDRRRSQRFPAKPSELGAPRTTSTAYKPLGALSKEASFLLRPQLPHHLYRIAVRTTGQPRTKLFMSRRCRPTDLYPSLRATSQSSTAIKMMHGLESGQCFATHSLPVSCLF